MTTLHHAFFATWIALALIAAIVCAWGGVRNKGPIRD